MKILQLGKFYPPDLGGIETVMQSLTEDLNQQNIQCDVLCSNSKNKYSEEKINGYVVYRTKSWGKYFSTSISPQMIFKLREIIDNYDIVHIHHPDPMATLALYYANTKKVKIVVHWHADIVKQKIILLFYSFLQQWMLRKSNLIVTTSTKQKNEIKWLKNFQEKTVSIPIGINQNSLNVDKNQFNNIKNKYADQEILCSLGRHVDYKGFEYLIKAGEFIDENKIILIGGSGPLSNELNKIIDNNNLHEKVKLIGKIEQNQLGAYFKACSIFCLPSVARSEAFGVVQLEAMTFSKPLIATNIYGSGTSWVNKHNKSGINVETQNSKEIANAINLILSSHQKYEEFSENSFKRFKNNFMQEKMINSFINNYKKIL